MNKEEYKAKKIAEAKEQLCNRDNNMMTGEPFCRLACSKEDVFDFLSQTIDELWALQNNSYPTVPAGFIKGGSTS